MQLNGLLPIGSVVLLKNSTKRLMIAGVVQQSMGERQEIWDYCGVLYPQGFTGASEMYMFNEEQIDKVYAIGYQDEEQFAFKSKVDALLKQVRAEEKK